MGVDWAKALIDSRMRANVALTWQYPDGLFLHGVYLAYKRLNNAPYLAYIKKWADANTAGKSPYNSLDDMQPTIVLDDMYREMPDPKYGTAPKAVAMRLETDYPKTSDGGFWHNTGATNQLWGDGVFMNLPAYVSSAQLFNNTKATDIATNQLIIYDKHIAAPNNLHVHQWDGAANKKSCCEWCRAEGWYEMALLMVLDETPATHASYAPLVAIAQRLAMGLAATQDPATGRWWQVMDKPNDGANWLETSCTAMHTYFLSKASQKGYVDAATYAPLAIKGFMGEMQMVSNPDDVQIKNICPGTGVLASPGRVLRAPQVDERQPRSGRVPAHVRPAHLPLRPGPALVSPKHRGRQPEQQRPGCEHDPDHPPLQDVCPPLEDSTEPRGRALEPHRRRTPRQAGREQVVEAVRLAGGFGLVGWRGVEERLFQIGPLSRDRCIHDEPSPDALLLTSDVVRRRQTSSDVLSNRRASWANDRKRPTSRGSRCRRRRL